MSEFFAKVVKNCNLKGSISLRQLCYPFAKKLPDIHKIKKTFAKQFFVIKSSVLQSIERRQGKTGKQIAR